PPRVRLPLPGGTQGLILVHVLQCDAPDLFADLLCEVQTQVRLVHRSARMVGHRWLPVETVDRAPVVGEMVREGCVAPQTWLTHEEPDPPCTALQELVEGRCHRATCRRGVCGAANLVLHHSWIRRGGMLQDAEQPFF